MIQVTALDPVPGYNKKVEYKLKQYPPMKTDKTIHTFVHPVYGIYWWNKAQLCKKFNLEHDELSKLVTGLVQNYQGWRVVTK